MTVPSIGTSIEALKFICARLQFHVSGASIPRRAGSFNAGKAGCSRKGDASSLIMSLRPCMGSGGPCNKSVAGPLGTVGLRTTLGGLI